MLCNSDPLSSPYAAVEVPSGCKMFPPHRERYKRVCVCVLDVHGLGGGLALLTIVFIICDMLRARDSL